MKPLLATVGLSKQSTWFPIELEVENLKIIEYNQIPSLCTFRGTVYSTVQIYPFTVYHHAKWRDQTKIKGYTCKFI